MNPPLITSLFAGLLAIVFFVLSVRTIRARRTARIAIGSGEDPALARAMRVHANFAEYAPFVLLLMALAELSGAWPPLVSLTGLCLLAGRIVHAAGVSRMRENLRLRITGMALTFTALISGALQAAIYGVSGLFAP